MCLGVSLYLLARASAAIVRLWDSDAVSDSHSLTMRLFLAALLSCADVVALTFICYSFTKRPLMASTVPYDLRCPT